MPVITRPPRLAAGRSRPGFTLAEMLVVMVLLTIVGGSLMGVLSKQQRFYRGVSDLGDLRSQLRQAEAVMSSDIRVGSSNDMHMFKDGTFDLVMSCAVHEHDKKFWLSVAEMHRVLRPGGLMVICVPGFDKLPTDVGQTTSTFHVHYRFDYYRFTRRAVREVFLEGLENVRVVSVLDPPRIIGHEMVGTVVHAGAQTAGFAPGATVTKCTTVPPTLLTITHVESCESIGTGSHETSPPGAIVASDVTSGGVGNAGTTGSSSPSGIPMNCTRLIVVGPNQ